MPQARLQNWRLRTFVSLLYFGGTIHHRAHVGKRAHCAGSVFILLFLCQMSSVGRNAGYHTSGGYCAPMRPGAPPAVPKVGQCPAGQAKTVT